MATYHGITPGGRPMAEENGKRGRRADINEAMAAVVCDARGAVLRRSLASLSYLNTIQ